MTSPGGSDGAVTTTWTGRLFWTLKCEKKFKSCENFLKKKLKKRCKKCIENDKKCPQRELNLQGAARPGYLKSASKMARKVPREGIEPPGRSASSVALPARRSPGGYPLQNPRAPHNFRGKNRCSPRFFAQQFCCLLSWVLRAGTR